VTLHRATVSNCSVSRGSGRINTSCQGGNTEGIRSLVSTVETFHNRERLPGYKVTRLPGYQVTRLPGYHVSRLLGYQVTMLPGY
jgi:hypothetical protein